MLGRDYYHKIASNFDPQGMAVPSVAVILLMFITMKCKLKSSNQQPTKDLSARNSENGRCRKGKEERCFGSPRIVSCTALRQLTSSRLLWRSPVTTLLCSTTHCHVPMLLRLGISTPRWRATPSLPMERCAQPLTWLSLDAILYYLLTYYIWNKRNITNHESNSWYISTNINVILSIHQVLYVLIT